MISPRKTDGGVDLVYADQELPRTAANGTSSGMTGGIPRWLDPEAERPRGPSGSRGPTELTCSECQVTFERPSPIGRIPKRCLPCQKVVLRRQRAVAKSKTQCSIPGCSAHVDRKKMCSMHARRLLIHGEAGPAGYLDRLKTPIAQRLIDLSRDEGACRVWTGFAPQGKGRIRVSDEQQRAAHVMSYITFVDETVDPGLYITQTCENDLCIKPGHLEATEPVVHFRRLSKKDKLNMVEPAVIRHWTCGETQWERGQSFYDFDNPDFDGGANSYCATICLRPREQYGALVIEADMVDIVASTWTAVREAVRKLGFPAPPMSLVNLKDR